jgi:hypothetical protein
MCDNISVFHSHSGRLEGCYFPVAQVKSVAVTFPLKI